MLGLATLNIQSYHLTTYGVLKQVCHGNCHGHEMKAWVSIRPKNSRILFTELYMFYAEKLNCLVGSVLDPELDPVGTVIIWLHGSESGSVIGRLPGSGPKLLIMAPSYQISTLKL